MPDTALIERFRSARSDPMLVVLEGLHALKHALRFGADVVDVRTRDVSEVRALAEELAPDVAAQVAALAESVDEPTFEELAPAPHPTGVIALAVRPPVSLGDTLAAPGPAPIVLLERATHHGNIGATVRVAAAAGAGGVLVTGPHDPWHPSSIRGGAGLQFALPVISLESEGLKAVLASGRPIVALDPAGEPLVESDPEGGRPTPAIPPRSVLVFGSERTGVSEALLARADRRIAIPMRPGVSSLNLATAVAATLYAAGGLTGLE